MAGKRTAVSGPHIRVTGTNTLRGKVFLVATCRSPACQQRLITAK
jgi:hypothetical protein